MVLLFFIIGADGAFSFLSLAWRTARALRAARALSYHLSLFLFFFLLINKRSFSRRARRARASFSSRIAHHVFRVIKIFRAVKLFLSFLRAHRRARARFLSASARTHE